MTELSTRRRWNALPFLSIWLIFLLVCLPLKPSSKHLKSVTLAIQERDHHQQQLNDETDVLSVSINSAATTATRPPLEDLVQNDGIIEDVQFLLDFAVIGFAKCGSTSMRNLLCNYNEEAQCLLGEARQLYYGKPAQMTSSLYNDLPQGNYKRGYKCPNDISQINTLRSLARYWPSIKLFIGLRHPVHWFESFWNMRMNNAKGVYPDPESLIGACQSTMHLCTDRALFHVELSRLGKTSMTAPIEVTMKRQNPKYYKTLPPPLSNKIFLFTTDQLADTNETRSALFKRDIQKFVGFERELRPIPHTQPGKKYHMDNGTKAIIESKRMNICDARHDRLRAVLMEAARPASEWIRHHFLESDDIVVSSREFFMKILETWMQDPCEGRVS